MAPSSPSHQERHSSRAASDIARICQTIESLVVAFILAFVFRAFVIEAFVIPTGSMANTLHGMHMDFLCPNCGYEYALGWNQRRRQPRRIVCPNCQTEILNPGKVRRRSGDRILVFKFPFDIGGPLLGPRRWDVVVLKSPADAKTNFIKRLIGLPSEVLEIIDGDIYTAPAENLSPTILAKLSQPPWSRQHLTAAEQEQLDRQLKIQTKTATAQQSLWFVVYDQDYPPTKPRRLGDRMAWQPLDPRRSAWLQHRRELVFDGLDKPLDQLLFVARQPTDSYAYNGQRGQPQQPVSDLRFQTVLIPHAGQGFLSIQISKQQDVFALQLHFDGLAELVHLQPQKNGRLEEVESLTTHLPPLRPGQAVRIAFSNVDHVARFELDGQEKLAMPWPADTELVRQRRRDSVPPEIVIAATDAKFVLRHVKLERDVYYRSPLIQEPRDPDTNAVNQSFMDAPGWGTAGHPIYLRSDEYFVLGDNSPESKDSRLWWYACDLLTPTKPLRQLMVQHRQNLSADQPLSPDQSEQVARHISDLRRTLQRAGSSRRTELIDTLDQIAQTIDRQYLPAAAGDHPSRALSILSQLQQRLATLDWQYYHLGTVPQDQLIGRAFFVYWPAGVAPFERAWGIIPNIGRMRLVR